MYWFWTVVVGITVIILLALSVAFSTQMAFDESQSHYTTGETLNSYGGGTPCWDDPNCHSWTETNIPKAILIGVVTFIGCLIASALVLLVLALIINTSYEAEIEEAIRKADNPPLKIERISPSTVIATKGHQRYVIENGIALLVE